MKEMFVIAAITAFIALSLTECITANPGIDSIGIICAIVGLPGLGAMTAIDHFRPLLPRPNDWIDLSIFFLGNLLAFFAIGWAMLRLIQRRLARSRRSHGEW